MRIIQTDGTVLEGNPNELAEFEGLLGEEPEMPEPRLEPEQKQVKVQRKKPKTQRKRRVSSSKSDEQIEKAMDYFVNHKVSIKRALIKFLNRRNNVGGTDYKRAREVLHKKYPKIADSLLGERSAIRHKKHQRDILVAKQEKPKRKKQRKKKYKKTRPDDIRRVRMKVIGKRIPTLIRYGYSRDDAFRKAQDEWKQGLLDKLKSEYYKKEFVDKAKKILKEQKKEVQTKPVEQPKPSESKSEQAKEEQKTFPLIYPIADEGTNTLIQQIKYVLKENIPLQYKHVSQIKLVLGKSWSLETWQSFVQFFIMNSRKISEYLGIPNRFAIDKVDGEHVIKYRGAVSTEV